jgi:hypothetical protein
MVQVKLAAPREPELSVAVTVTELGPAVVGVPDTVPVPELTERPAGRPVADQEVMVAPSDESVAALANEVMAEPETLDRAPGLVTVTAPVTVQVNMAAPMAPELSLAVRVTG